MLLPYPFRKANVIRLLFLIFLSVFLFRQEVSSLPGNPALIARFIVNSGNIERVDTPLSFNLDQVTSLVKEELALYELDSDKSLPVSFQVTGTESRQLDWLMQGYTGAGKTRIYELRHGGRVTGSGKMRVQKYQGYFQLYHGEKPVLRYNSGVTLPPPGADLSYQRSGFIHPLFAPNQAILTNIQPPGHLHQYGIMNPWTRTTFRGKTVDFWNLGKKEGTVRFRGLVAAVDGPIFSGLQALHEHVAWPGTPDETIAMNELLDIRTFNREDGSFLVDLISTLNPVERLTLEEYLYGGFLIRGTEYWTHENSIVFTSEGLDREGANEQRARWLVVQGDTPEGEAGILVMSHPSNFNHPEPVRVWNSTPERARDHFINISPTMDRSWLLEAGNKYFLRYRMLVFNGNIDKEKAERTWMDYAYPPVITLEREKDISGKWDNRTGDIKDAKLLVYTKVGDDGFVHKSIPASVEALKKLAGEKEFSVDVTDHPGVFNDESLKQYHALVFANTNNDVFSNDDQRIALKRYIQAGGGFVGIHIALGTERNWEWFKRMIGATFDRHPPYQEFEVKTIDEKHPSVAHLPDPWVIEDEPYYVKEYNPGVRVLMAHNLETINDRQARPEIFGDLYPSVWCNTFDGGRQWYTGYGHDDHIYSDHMFMEHILGGIKWVIANGLPDYSRAYSTVLK